MAAQPMLSRELQYRRHVNGVAEKVYRNDGLGTGGDPLCCVRGVHQEGLRLDVAEDRVAPAMRIALTVATAVFATVMTSSPSHNHYARKAIARASVPLPTPIAWPATQESGTCSPRCLYAGPQNKFSDRKTWSMPEKSPALSLLYCWR